MHDLHADPSPPELRLPIRMLRAVDVIYARIFHNITVLNPSHLPKSGPAILVSNHTSGLDPVLIQSVCSRLVVWMMAKEYYDINGLTWIFRQIQAIPVHRSGRDLAATRVALRSLQLGRILGVFPEGRIEEDDNMLDFQTGIALVAIRSGAPVLPVALIGSQQRKEMPDVFSERQKAILNFGPPVEIDRSTVERDNLQRVTLRIRDAVSKLKCECMSQRHELWR